jgi:hypothetical protein
MSGIVRNIFLIVHGVMRFRDSPLTLQRTFREAFLPIDGKIFFYFVNLLVALFRGKPEKSFQRFTDANLTRKSAVKADYDSGAVHQSGFVRRLAGFLD